MAASNNSGTTKGSVLGFTPGAALPAAPTGVTATNGDGSASIDWSAVAGATSYNIYYSTTFGVPKATATKITTITSPSIVTGLTNGTTYYFVVTAVNAAGEGVESSQVSATPTAAPPGRAVAVTKTSGDLQTIVQHTSLTEPLTVIVTDALGNGVPNVSVAFSAVPESGYIRPVTITTVSDGSAGFMSYIHTSGQLQIEASVSGIPSVIFTINITPSVHPFDGEYGCSFDSELDFWFSVSSGVLSGGSRDKLKHFSGMSYIIEPDGIVENVRFRESLDYNRWLWGQIVVDSLQNATAVGTYLRTYEATPVSEGTWSCERQ
jgi:hypothetical protein